MSEKSLEMWDQFLEPYNKIPIPVAIWIQFSDEIVLVDANQYAIEITDGFMKDLCGCFASEMYQSHIKIVKCLKKCLKEKEQLTKDIKIRSSKNNKTVDIKIRFLYSAPGIIYMIFYSNIPEWVWKELNFIKRKDLKKPIKSKQIRKLKESIIKGTRPKAIEKVYRDLFMHDINNIFSNIQSSTQLCSFFLKQQRNYDKIVELFDIILDQVNRGKKAISNIFTYLEIEDNSKHLKKINIIDYLKNSIEYIHKSYLTREIKIIIHSEREKYYILANELVEPLFDNILINAVKYNEQDIVKIIINISAIEKDKKSYIKIEFEDNGIGISDDKKAEIFSMNYKKTKESYGMGIGLSLVKRIVNILNGKVWVEDRVQGNYRKGANFVFLLPEFE